jgi:hypothetical protein
MTAPTPSPEGMAAHRSELARHFNLIDRSDALVCECGEAFGYQDYEAQSEHRIRLALTSAYAVDMPKHGERIATAIKNTPTPHDVFLANESGTWVKARRVFEAVARNPEEPA